MPLNGSRWAIKLFNIARSATGVLSLVGSIARSTRRAAAATLVLSGSVATLQSTNSTFTGDAADAYINNSTTGGYAGCRAGTLGGKAVTSDATLHVGQTKSAVGPPPTFVTTWTVRLGYIKFDTSSIPDGSTVTAASLQLWLTTDNSGVDFVTEARVFDWGAAVESADYVPGANLSSDTLLATIDSNGIGSTGAYKTFSSDAGFAGQINKTGTTYMVLCSAEDTNNSEPTTATDEYLVWASAGDSGHEPKLTVTYTV